MLGDAWQRIEEIDYLYKWRTEYFTEAYLRWSCEDGTAFVGWIIGFGYRDMQMKTELLRG
jgi:hypothetical protein